MSNVLRLPFARELELGRVGESVKRVDGVPKTTGEFEYASDLSAAGMLWGHTLRSPHAHARILSIDISGALTMEGVHAVLTHEDVPGQKTYGLEFADQPVLAIDRVRCFGEPVAVVAAEHPEQARRAPSGSSSVRAARDRRRSRARHGVGAAASDRPTAGHGYRDDPRPNIVRTMLISHGNPDTGGEVSVSGYTARHAGPGLLGPSRASPCRTAAVAWTSTSPQWLHVDRDQIAPCLALSPDQVRSPRRCRWTFGGREDLSMQIHSALLALHTNRPVKMVYNREESFTGTAIITGADLGRAPRDGRRPHRERADADPARRRRLRRVRRP
jgi:hypothetical protein